MKDGRLEVSDLMIGDWVDVRCDAAPNSPHIERITPAHFLRNEIWLPIPLTPEILEKNGFRLIDDSYYYSDGDNVVLTKNYGNYPGEHKFDWVKHTKGINKRGQYANIDYYIATIDYVHELQHALKLCGIEKTIEL